jgi:FMN reductase
LDADVLLDTPSPEGPLVVGIGGSTSTTSVTVQLLRESLAILRARGARTVEFAGGDLASVPIYGTGDASGPMVEAMVASVRQADAVVVATPAYHGGMSGLVKNTLDHLEALRHDVRPYLDGRVVGPIVAAAGWQACGSALVAVRSTIHALRGWPTPFGVTINTAEQFPRPDGTFDDPVTDALQTLAEQILLFAGWTAASRVHHVR